MNHEKYKELIQLYVYNELNAAEKTSLENHLSSCTECRSELELQKKLISNLTKIKSFEVDDTFLNEARSELRAALRRERSRETFGKKLTSFIGSITQSPYKAAFAGLTLVALGFLFGYLNFHKADIIIAPTESKNDFSSLENNIQINNVKFIDQDASDGEIEFTFEAIKPVHIKGSIDDERIQNVLVYSMLNEQNPGVRLNAINVIGEKSPSGKMDQRTQLDNDIKTALLSVVKYDENPGVRREALKILRTYPYDDEIKEVLLYVLMNDENSGLRIEAISGLNEASKKGMNFNPEELSIFKERMERDENNYVRYQAKTVLKEYNLNEN